MANKRELKKGINAFTSEIVSDCFMFIELNKLETLEPVANIINNIVTQRDIAFSQINKPSGERSRKETKEYYENIISDFLQVFDQSANDLSKLATKS